MQRGVKELRGMKKGAGTSSRFECVSRGGLMEL
jgi:hypothetical protein